MNYSELSTEELREEAKKIEVNFQLQKTEIGKVYYSRPEVIKSCFGNVLTGIDDIKHPYLSSILNKIAWCKEISGKVSTYRTDIPFEGLKIIDDKKQEYTAIYQGDSDYDYCFDAFCEGNKPEIKRSSQNLWNVEQDMINDTYGMSIDELEDYLRSKRDYLENQEEGGHLYHIEILTILHSISCM